MSSPSFSPKAVAVTAPVYPDLVDVDLQSIFLDILNQKLNKEQLAYQGWLLVGFLLKQMVGAPDQIMPIGAEHPISAIDPLWASVNVKDPKLAKFFLTIVLKLLLNTLV